MTQFTEVWKFARRSRAFQVACVLMALSLAMVVWLRWHANRGVDEPLTWKLIPANGTASELILVVPGLNGDGAVMGDVIAATREKRPSADILVVEYPSQTFSNADCFHLAIDIRDELQRRDGEQYKSIKLLGFSMGALLARKAYIYGLGYTQDSNPDQSSPAESSPKMPWVDKVDRFVLLAGMNRGWTTRSRPQGMSLTTAWLHRAGTVVARATGTGQMLLQLRQGEPFVANLRLQWLTAMQQLPDSQHPVVVQFLGDRDDIVSSVDNRDIVVSNDFLWIQLRGTGHADAKNFTDGPFAPERRQKFLRAMGNDESLAELRQQSSRTPVDTDSDVTTAVIVLHGIRDLGEWSSTFESKLQERFLEKHRGEKAKLAVHQPSYGYFGLGPFLLWADRQKNVRWFMDDFTELKARYPNLRQVHFIGHSNGTYVLASALKKYKSIKVNRVVFAGSVLRRDFDWSSLKGQNRIDGLRNYVGASDWVVGIFPNLFEYTGLRAINPDIGGAGFMGFTDPFAKQDGAQVTYVAGSHGAGLQSEHHDAIVSYILDGEIMPPKSEDFQQTPSGKVALASKLCWLIWILIVVAVLLLGRFWYRWLTKYLHDRRNWRRPLAATASLSSYVFVAWMILCSI